MTLPMSAISIRPMERDDVTGVAAWMVCIPLWQRYGLQQERAAAQLEQGLAVGDLLLVADVEPEGRARGFVWCLMRGAFGLSPYIRLIGVAPGRSGSGIGGRLLDEVERRVAGSNRDLFLLVSDFNVDARRFYERRGFQQIGELRDYVLPGVAEVLYRKRLTLDEQKGGTDR